MAEPRQTLDDELLVHAFARLHPRSLALALGAVGGLGFFAATAVLLLKTALGIDPPAPVGPHLGKLAAFFPGYAVSWPGAVLGLAYGFAAGALLGTLIALLMNLQRRVALELLLRRARRGGIDDGL